MNNEYKVTVGRVLAVCMQVKSECEFCVREVKRQGIDCKSSVLHLCVCKSKVTAN